MTKAGFAGDEVPDIVFPSVVGVPRHPQIALLMGQNPQAAYVGEDRDGPRGKEANRRRGVLRRRVPIERGLVVHWEEVEQIWHHVFFNELRIALEETGTTRVAALTPREDRERSLQIMFDTFQVPSVYLAVHQVLSFYSSGRLTGLVVDCAATECRMAPVCEGILVAHVVRKLHLGGQDLTQYLMKLLVEKGYCFTGGSNLQAALWSNVVLAGGCSLLRGLPQRLELELKRLEAAVEVVAPEDRKYSAWIGGSLISSMKPFEKMCISKDAYCEKGPGIFRDGDGIVPLLLRPLGRAGGCSATAASFLAGEVLSRLEGFDFRGNAEHGLIAERVGAMLLEASVALRDLWSFDVLQHRWSLVPMSIGAPTQRWSHVAAWDGTFLWLHGGWSSTGSLRELWKFDPLLTLWSLLSDAGPAARHDHVATYDEIDHSLLVHGGWDGDQVFGDLWKFQERLRRWSRVSESVEARPTARFDHAAAYDAQRRTWWLHGGGNGVEGFTDLWALDVPTLQWTQVARGSGPSTWETWIPPVWLVSGGGKESLDTSSTPDQTGAKNVLGFGDSRAESRFLLLVYLVFCLFLMLSFLSTAPLPDAHAWLVTWVLAVIQALLIIPMLAAFGLCMFVGVYLRCDPAGAEEIKKLRQIIMEPPPVVSIWDGDIMDDTYGAHGTWSPMPYTPPHNH
eukprot:g15873.t1